MVTAFVMMQVERGKVNEVAGKLAEMEGVREVHSVTGEYDLVAIVWVRDNDMLSEVVTGRLQKVDGILRTSTMVAFRVFSKHDLEELFG